MPSHLGEVAACKWAELLPLLQAVKVMTRADIEALARYCDTYEWWLATRAKLKKEGDTYPILNDKGDIKYIAQRPEVAIAHKLAAQLHVLEADFGLNPSSRTKLATQVEVKKDELEEFFAAHG
jgi:P27 family predicted phage terminase small subunit